MSTPVTDFLASQSDTPVGDFLKSSQPVSARLPTPAQAVQVANDRAQSLVRNLQTLTMPDLPKPPLPQDLETPAQAKARRIAANTPSYINSRTGARYYGDDAGTGPLGVLDAPRLGAEQVAAGVEQAAEPGFDAKAGGISKAIRGGMTMALPLVAGAGIVAPLPVAATVGTSMLAGKGVEAGATKLGASPGGAALAGDAASILAGGVTGRATGLFDFARKLELHNDAAARLVESDRASGLRKETGEALSQKIFGEPTPVSIDGQPHTVELAGTGPEGRPFFQVRNDATGKPVFGGYGENTQAFLKARGAAAPEAPTGESAGPTSEPVAESRPGPVQEFLKKQESNERAPVVQGGTETAGPVQEFLQKQDLGEERPVVQGGRESRAVPGPESKPTVEPQPENLQRNAASSDSENRLKPVPPPTEAVADNRAAEGLNDIKKAAPEPGTVVKMPTSEIQADPVRFQFKSNVGQGGAGEEFRGVTKFDPEKSGLLSVWHDPADQQTYVVNGHHRLEMAQRLGEPSLDVRYLDAANATEARTKGALINIAEGRGDSVDAAKVFRDSGLDAAGLEREGVSLKGQKASEGLALAKLEPGLFSKVVSGELPAARGAIIGEGLPEHADQAALMDALQAREKNGKRATNDQIAEMIRLTPPAASETQESLFGAQEMSRSLIPEKAEVSEYVRKQLGQEKKLFENVSSDAAAAKLGEQGNVIQAGKNAGIAARTAQAQALYDKLSTSSGPVNDALDGAASAIAKGEDAAAVKARVYGQIKQGLIEQAGRLGGAGETSGVGLEGHAPGRAIEAGGRQYDPGVAAGDRQAGANAGVERGASPAALDRLKPVPPQTSKAVHYNGQPLTRTEAMKLPAGPGRTAALRAALAGKTQAKQVTPDFSAPEYTGPVSQARAGDSSTTLGSGLGSFEPYLRESASEMRALKAKRDAALAELERAKASPEQKGFGRHVIESFTGERDLWSARVNQAVEKLRKIVPKPEDQEALSLMREHRDNPEELRSWLDGEHPVLRELGAGDRDAARRNIERLRPSIERALNPTPAMQAADQVLTKIAGQTLKEGQKLGFLESRWTPEEYVPHILHPKNQGEIAQPVGDRLGQALGGKIGRYFAFAETRGFPKLLEAVAHNYKPKTLNALDAFTIHGDKFATARATHLMVQQIQDSGLGIVEPNKDHWPEGWRDLAGHSPEFRHLSHTPLGATGPGDVIHGPLIVPKFVDEALRPVTDPEFLGALPGFRKLRVFQAYTKAIQLGLSMFHATTENYMALWNMGPKGWVQGLRADRSSPEFVEQERDFIAHGGTTAVQGRTVEAYKALQPGSIPTWNDIWRRAPVVREMDQFAQHFTDFTFGKLQRQFKVTDYALHKAGWIGKNPLATPEQTAAAMQSIAKEINAVYGGLHWENLGVNKASVEVARAVMLAPDWTFSNVFNVKYAFEGTPAGSLARRFWIRQLVGGLLATQLLSLALSRKPSKNPTQVYMGRDRKGKDIYQNIFFKGVAGDVINLAHNVVDYGAVQGLARTMAGKAAPVVRAGLQLISNRDFLGREIVPKGMHPVAGTVRAAAETAKALAPVPLSVGNVKEMLLGPNAKDYKLPEFLTTMFAGNPPRHVGPAKQHPWGQRSVWQQMKTGKVWRGDPDRELQAEERAAARAAR